MPFIVLWFNSPSFILFRARGKIQIATIKLSMPRINNL